MANFFRSVREYFDTRHRVPTLSVSQPAIENWFETDYGQYLLHHEQRALTHLMPSSGAHRMLYLGVTSQRQLPEAFNHLHNFSLGVSAKHVGDSPAVADYDALPLPSETIDTVLLHHALEFSENPHEVLKETTRVLKPTGHMALVVLNPISLFGLTKWSARLLSSQGIWRYHSLRQGRILDWLRLLNCQPIKISSGCFSWPMQWPREDDREMLMDRLGQKYRLPCGAYYIVIARKYVARPTLSGKIKWKTIRIPAAPVVKKDSVLNQQLSQELSQQLSDETKRAETTLRIGGVKDNFGQIKIR